MAEERCLDAGPECIGPVEMRLNTRTWVSFPRCEFHWEKRKDAQRRVDREYPDQATPPPGFDPSAAGEQWGDD